MVSRAEIDRRYQNIRAALEAAKLDALVVSGSQYTGFEGAVRYVSGFEIVHRYVYVLIPLRGDPLLVFPTEARWIGDKKKPWVQEHIWAQVPGEWLRDHAAQQGWKRLGIYGLDYIMTVRDYRALSAGAVELVPFDYEFDLARAVKSPEELEAIRDSMSIIVDGFYALLEAYEPGKTEAEIMAPAVELFFARGAGPRMMNIVLSGTHGEAEAHFKVPGHRRVSPDDLLLYSLELAGAEGYWVEFSRPIIRGEPSARSGSTWPEARRRNGRTCPALAIVMRCRRVSRRRQAAVAKVSSGASSNMERDSSASSSAGVRPASARRRRSVATRDMTSAAATPLPDTSPMATVTWPGCGRSAWMRSAKLASVPCSASMLIAHAKGCRPCFNTSRDFLVKIGMDDAELTHMCEAPMALPLPERERRFVEFTLRVARDPGGLKPADFREMERAGFKKDEILEMIGVAGYWALATTVSSALEAGLREE